MNGRVYDPAIGRFMSADPYVQEPFNAQNLNRFSYALNNPLAYVDPSGFQYVRQGKPEVGTDIPSAPTGFEDLREAQLRHLLAMAQMEAWLDSHRASYAPIWNEAGVIASGVLCGQGTRGQPPFFADADFWKQYGQDLLEVVYPSEPVTWERENGEKIPIQGGTAPLGGLGKGLGKSASVIKEALARRAAARALLPSSKRLGRALEAAGVIRPAGSAAHHIVAGSAPGAAAARAALEKFGMGINEATNGVFLPTAQHKSLHT